MMTCQTCKHYITAVCANCQGFDDWEFKIPGEVRIAKNEDDNVVYTVTDNINSPAHYANRKFETIDVIEDCIKANKLDGYQGYLLGNIIKYISRANVKGEMLENLKKAHWYLNRLIEVRESEKVHG